MLFFCLQVPGHNNWIGELCCDRLLSVVCLVSLSPRGTWRIDVA